MTVVDSGVTDPFDMFDKDGIPEGLFDVSAFDWPYSGERTVTLGPVAVEAHETFGNIYDDADKRLSFDDAKAYDTEDLPAGYEFAPQIDLVLYATVDDAAIPEPQYPPKIRLGDTRSVEFDADKFWFVKKDGTPRNPQANSNFAEFIRTLSQLVPGFGAKFASVAKDPKKVFSTTLFDGVTVVFDAVEVGTGQYKKVRAWPTSAVGESQESGEAAASVDLAGIAAESTDGADFRNKVLSANLGDADLLRAVVQDPDGEWEKAKAS